MREKVRYGLTNVDNVHPPMPGIHVLFKHASDERDFGENTDNDAGSEDDGDQRREDQELPEAVWALVHARVSVPKGAVHKKEAGAY